MPARLNVHQSRVLWERCLRREISSPLLNIAAVINQARDAWTLLHDYCVTLDEAGKAARGRDQGIFARAARRFQASLTEQDWVDEAGLPALAAHLVERGATPLPGKLVLAGFDRQTPAVLRLLDVLRKRGCGVDMVNVGRATATARVASFEDTDAELRAAGAWARERLTRHPSASVAIVATHLERDAERSARLVREGLAPGWQTGSRLHHMAVNVSYGRRLGQFPMIATALLALM